MSKPGFTKKVKAKLSQLSLPYRRSKNNKINNVSGDNNNNSDERKHDVFLSFRGEDTRRTVTSHLYKALSEKNVVTFKDDENLSRGDEISLALSRATSGSKISVVIFSRDYASSTWCLRELVEIMSCKRLYGQIVIPVFYNVDRSHVREQTGSFMDSFAKHEQFQSQQDLQRWRDALKEASNLPGWDVSVTKPEAELVDEIVKDILNKLPLSDSKGPIGIDSGDGGSRGGGDDGDDGSGLGGNGDNDGGDKTEGGSGVGGGGKMGTIIESMGQPDFRDFRYNAGDENGYPVGQLHRRNYVCSIRPDEKYILMATAVMAAGTAQAAAAMIATAIIMVGIKLKGRQWENRYPNEA